MMSRLLILATALLFVGKAKADFVYVVPEEVEERRIGVQEFVGKAEADFVYVVPVKEVEEKRIGVQDFAEGLYWRVLQNDMGCDCNPAIGNHKSNWGYRVGFFCDFARPERDFGVIWTHLNFNTRHHHESESNWRWKFNYDTIDLITSGDFCLNRCLLVRPFGGLRLAKIDQKSRSHVEKVSQCISDSFEIIKDNRDKADFNGLGPSVGIAAYYNFDGCTSIFGSISTGVLYGNFVIKSHGSETFTNPDETCFCSVRRTKQATQVFSDASIGIRWEGCSGRCANFILQISLEHHAYYQFNRLGNSGDLYLDGVSGLIGLKF